MVEQRDAIDIHAINIALCKALGFNPGKVKALTVRVRGSGQLPEVTVEYTAHVLQEHPEFAETLSRFELVPVAEDQAVA